MKISTLAAVMLCLFFVIGELSAAAGIKGLYVFGDSFSDTGNAALYEPPVSPVEGQEYSDYQEPYWQGRASNGPVWIEVLASAYGYDVSPALAGGRNYAFAGAETGGGFSDQGTLNFQSQIRLFKAALQEKRIKNIHPKDLFVVWVGINDFLRIQAEGGTVTGDDIQKAVENIGKGILALHEEGARLFLVPDMPAVYLTPDILAMDEENQQLMKRLVNAFNKSLEKTLRRIELDPKITILRLSTYRIFVSIFDNPWMYGFENVTDAAILTEPVNPDAPWSDYFSWDGFHPTTSGHAVLAQYAMDVIPIGSWWGHSVARGPDGTAVLGMGWVDDDDWPWLYLYSYQDGEWIWAYEEAGNPEGFLAYVPSGYKWIWVNALSGWYYNYETAQWVRFEDEP